MPLVSVVVPVAVNDRADLNDVVPEVLLITKAARVEFPLLVIVPVPTMVGVTVVNVPPLDNVRLPAMFSAVVPGLNPVVPKSKLLNQLPLVSVCTNDDPVVNDKLGAVAVEPPALVPHVYVAVLNPAASLWNPPGPEGVKPVSVAIARTVTPVPPVRFMYPAEVVPKAIERPLVLLELNIPKYNVIPLAMFNVPAVNRYVARNELE